VCLHSLGLARHPTKRRAEIDFLVVTPRGIFVLEVKGGRIRREAGVWIFTDRYGAEHQRAEGPFDQAASAMFALEQILHERLASGPGWSPLFAYGVVLPDVEFAAIGPEGDPEIVYDARDRQAPFGAFLDRLARFAERRTGRPRSRLSSRDIGAIIDSVRGDFDVVPSMEVVVEDARERLASLTREQSLVLDAAADAPRLLVEGAAGSGKTLLAAESARREARRGLRVLLLCFSRLLAKHLGSLVGEERFSGSVEVQTVHGLFRRLIERSSLKEEFGRRSDSMTAELVLELLYPEYAGLACLEEVAVPYDVLIVDEAQDVLGPNVFDVLSLLVFGGLASGRWRLFMDVNNQASIYGRLDEKLLARIRSLAPVHLLTTNCRNTRPIAIQTHVVANPRVRCEARADGPPVEFETYENRSGLFETLRDVIARLDGEHFAGAGLTVLLPRTPVSHEEALLEQMGLGRYSAEEHRARPPLKSRKGRWATVSAFKGLESDVVILAGLDDIDAEWWQAVAYVGMSRARFRLVTILREACEARRRERFAAEIDRSLRESEVMW